MEFITTYLNELAVYLAVVNISAFLLLFINAKIKSSSLYKWINILASAFSIAGGSLGAVFAILLFDRKAKKENMMSRVVIIVFFVLQILLILWLFQSGEKKLSFDLITYFQTNVLASTYFLTINLITFILFAVDKIAAIKERRRIPIVTLLCFSFFGGSIGGLAAMYLLHHKTKKNYFSIGIPLMILMQLCVLIFIINL